MVKLVDLEGNSVSFTSLKKIKDVVAAGTQVLVELLTDQELMNTSLILANKGKNSKGGADYAAQGYIISIGASVKAQDWGIKVGDRVIISSGNCVPAPKREGCDRERYFMDPHAIKGVVIEE